MRNEFKFHKLNREGVQKATLIADEFTKFLDALESICGNDGRYMAIVRTKLEEASFFAKKAIATLQQFQDNE